MLKQKQMQEQNVQPAAIPTTPTPRERFEAADPELWDAMAEALIAQDPWPEESVVDPLGGIAMGTYEVVEVKAGEGVRLEEVSVTVEERPLFWIADARAAELFEHGDVFGFGWNDDETLVWPPERGRSDVSAA